MEIELPDGTVLEAPDGSDPKQVVRGYHTVQLKVKNPGEYDPKSAAYADKYGPVGPGFEGFREGIGSGMKRMNKGISNVANKVLNSHPLIEALGGFELPGKEFYSDESINAQDKLDTPLAKTTRGRMGQMVGQSAVAAGATAPLGGLGALSRGGGVLTRTLANPTLRAGVEGAVTGAGAAAPDDQASGAQQGALAGAVINKFLQGGGRMTRGLVKKNEATRDLEDMAGQTLDIPISQAAADTDVISRGARALYQEGLPNILGVKGRMARQSKEAQRLARQNTSGDLAEAVTDEVFSEPATRTTGGGRLATNLGLGGLSVYGSPVPALAALLGGNVMATKVVQRALMGDTMAQRHLARLVAIHPEMTEPLGRYMRTMGESQTGAGENGE